MSKAFISYLSLIVYCALVSAPAMALDLGGHDRDGVVVGLTLGHGWNGVELTDGNGINRDTGDLSAFTGALKVGWARNDQLVAFVGLSGWKRSFAQDITPSSATNLNLLAELYFYPRGQGFWVKGGVGTGSLDFYVNAPLPENRITFKEGGFTYTVGAGYEFRVAPEMAVGFAYDYTNIGMGDFGAITDAATVNQVFAMSFHYYYQ